MSSWTLVGNVLDVARRLQNDISEEVGLPVEDDLSLVQYDLVGLVEALLDYMVRKDDRTLVLLQTTLGEIGIAPAIAEELITHYTKLLRHDVLELMRIANKHYDPQSSLTVQLLHGYQFDIVVNGIY